MNRRNFLQSIAVAAITPAIAPACVSTPRQIGALRPDPGQLLDLPEGFSYSVVSRAGTPMNDGLRVPGAHDGMAAFSRSDGRLVIVCNHEMLAGWPEKGAFADGYDKVPEAIREKLYDRGADVTPALGGTTTTIWNPGTAETERQFLSLGGTEINCAGGATPWGTWLSCEETFSSPGSAVVNENRIARERRHGYVFEVPADAGELVPAEPLVGMGRFEHEAAAVDPETGVVYLTEDRRDSLLYRFIPARAGQLAAGGQLQALALGGYASGRTDNHSAEPDIRINDPRAAHWIDIETADVEENNLRLDYARAGAVTFSRGEGICHAGDRFAFTATEGGSAKSGQVFTYRPTSADGGELELIAEVQPDSIMQYCDNIAMAPWGELICCEDRGQGSGLIGIRADGSFYPIARNSHSNSELAGVCFSPDGTTLFVNIQYPGMTLAISGPWPRLD